MTMKQIILNIPDNKYSFVVELIKYLGLEKESDKLERNGGSKVKKQKNSVSGVAALRGKLHLSQQQYADFHQHVSDGRTEWERGI